MVTAGEMRCLGHLRAECKYCWHKTVYGKTTHFYCSAFQYCCGDKCCENIDEFYKLWYFWCVLILILLACIACYWLRRWYMSQIFIQAESDRGQLARTRHRRSVRRYRQLTGDSSTTAPSFSIPDSVVISPPPYQGNNTGCPHLGLPPYTLGSGSSINSILPRFPPPYSQIEQLPPPTYSSR